MKKPVLFCRMVVVCLGICIWKWWEGVQNFVMVKVEEYW